MRLVFLYLFNEPYNSGGEKLRKIKKTKLVAIWYGEGIPTEAKQKSHLLFAWKNSAVLDFSNENSLKDQKKNLKKCFGSN